MIIDMLDLERNCAATDPSACNIPSFHGFEKGSFRLLDRECISTWVHIEASQSPVTLEDDQRSSFYYVFLWNVPR